LRKTAVNEGMVQLREAALQKVRESVTSVDEVLKRTVMTKESLPAYLVNPDSENYGDGDVIIQEGNQDNDFFELIQGAVIIVKSGKKISEIDQPGAYLGEMSAISGEPRSATVFSKGQDHGQQAGTFKRDHHETGQRQEGHVETSIEN
jgi:type IV pilus assembly protein PilB